MSIASDVDPELSESLQLWQGSWNAMKHTFKQMSGVSENKNINWTLVKAYANIMEHMEPLEKDTVLWRVTQAGSLIDPNRATSACASKEAAEKYAAAGKIIPPEIIRMVVKSENVMGLRVQSPDPDYADEEEVILAPHFKIKDSTTKKETKYLI